MLRCYDPEHKMYKYYGGKGVLVCNRWHKFKNFYKDMGVPTIVNPTVDRISSSKNYQPENCTWTSWYEQRRNRTDNKFITFAGISEIETDWCYALGFRKGGSISRRLARGWGLERSLTIDNNGNRVVVSELKNRLGKLKENETFFCKKTKSFKGNNI